MTPMIPFRLLMMIMMIIITTTTTTGLQLSPREPSPPRHQQQKQQKQQLGSFEPLNRSESERVGRLVRLEDWVNNNDNDYNNDDNTLIDFEDAWERQQCYLQRHLDRLAVWLPHQESVTTDDTTTTSTTTTTTSTTKADTTLQPQFLPMDRVLFVQHTPVYTLGTASDPSYILSTTTTTTAATTTTTTIPIVRIDRGGEVTYHGPGQLTVYPVLDLRHYKQDIHWYIRALEECVIVALQRCGVTGAYRDPHATGVWIQNHKVAAIGIQCRRWITQHGVAINVQEDSLRGFAGIVACGLPGRQVGYVNQFVPPNQPLWTVRTFAPWFQQAMEQVFEINLVRSGDNLDQERSLSS